MRTVVQVKGGLGNQLFQLAFALERSIEINEAFALDVSYFDLDARHGGFLLNKLFEPEVFRVLKLGSLNSFDSIFKLDRFPDLYCNSLIRAPGIGFYSGYFQNYGYLQKSLPRMRDLFSAGYERLKATFFSESDSFNSLADSDGRELIGIHLRRGDYLNEENLKVHGLVDPNASLRLAVKVRRERESLGRKTNLIVFSDSEALTSIDGEPIRQYKSHHFESKYMRDFEEFLAMGSCDQLICANSTFSYWAALLSSRTRVAYIPNLWMKSGSVRTESLLGGIFRSYPADLL
jgi:hypothetical protein